MTNEPLVSVLMTAYNREKYIAEAIESVLASSYKNFELIIVDDCSADNTVQTARLYEKKDERIKVYENETNLGDYLNRNKAASYAKGKYLKYVDSDDIIYRHSLAIMVESMEAYPEVSYGFLNYPNQDDRGPFPLLFTPEQAYYEHFFCGGFFYAGPVGTIIRKSLFDKIGGFSGTRMVGDYELWLKFGAATPILKIQSGLIWWRANEGQEYQIGHTSDLYVKLNYEVALNALQSITCPLSLDLKRIAINNTKRMQARRICKLFVKGNFYSAVDIMRFSGLNLPAILLCWVPVNRLKKMVSKAFS